MPSSPHNQTATIDSHKLSGDWRNVINGLPTAVLLFDQQGRLVHANDSASTLPLYNALQQPLTSTSALQQLQRQLHSNDGQPFSLQPTDASPVNHRQLYSQRQQGQRDYYSLHAQRVVANAGQPPLLMVSLQDITEQISNDQLRREERERLSFIIEGTRAGTWEWDMRNNTMQLNDRWANMLGYQLAELLPLTAQTWERFIHPDDLVMSNQLIEQLIAGEIEFYDCEVRLKHRAGHWIWVQDRGQISRRDSNGTPLSMSGTHIEVTERKLAQQRLQGLAKSIPGVIYQYRRRADGSTHFPFVSEGVRDIYQLTPAQIAEDASHVISRIHPDDLQLVADTIEQSAQTLQRWSCEYRTQIDGEIEWLSGVANPSREDDGSIVWHGIITNISERKLLEQQFWLNRERLQMAQDVAQLGYWDMRLDTGVIYWSDILFDIYQRPRDLTPPSMDDYLRYLHPADLNDFLAYRKTVNDLHWHDIEHRVCLPNGEIRWLAQRSKYARNSQGERIIMGTTQDITDRKHLEERLREQVNQDALTGLFNRRYFMLQLQQLLSSSRDQQQSFALLMLDLDHFKQINDNYGHLAGDQVLQHFAMLLQQLVSVETNANSNATIARLGGEEFAILVNQLSSQQAAALAERIVSELGAQPVSVDDNQHIAVTTSIGVCLNHRDIDSASDMLSRADKALYTAKHNGRNRYEMYR
ncbi:PAS/PAC sensor-containing diguanylate cyclase [Idiomarina xiamenensis 10-D-4]|uniref:PAS/PAC sensor-containing diguanylate cyclase n=2 Tax=Idiomarina xiamenensis TaxID=1207041 RepID=K2JFJ8_9GAMM|nr:PAS/PAC sensor-containing diguanylate cyclase [Idiomarina xiamenensis 10-D-4]